MSEPLTEEERRELGPWNSRLLYAAVQGLIAAREAALAERIAEAIEARADLWGDPHRNFCVPDFARIARSFKDGGS